MTENAIARQLQGFGQWRQRQQKILGQLTPWLKQQGLYTAEAHSAIEQGLEALHDDSLLVAVIGEFSRGKTELINALFFADHGRRLLPTDAGRTTMCPTEIFQDLASEPCIQLLPIETRRTDASLRELRDDPEAWLSRPLDIDDPDALERELQALSAAQTVSIEDAARMGLARMDDALLQDRERVEVPRWRLARINYRHPLLERGLRILDTPGLNALGNEPELTYEMLPAAHALMFVLGADTGVTRSDLDIWEQCLHLPGGSARTRGVMVVLNKTDTLWDELRGDAEVGASIDRQRADVAQRLGIAPEQVFATSAQKALFARIRDNAGLEERSGVLHLERHLARSMVENHLHLVMGDRTRHVAEALATLENLVTQRLRRNKQQIRNLEALSGQSEAAVNHMLNEAQRDKQRYHASVQAYKVARDEFERHGKILLAALDMQSLEEVIEEARNKMTTAWTTRGLKDAMVLLFRDINRRMDVISSETQSMRRHVRTIYKRFQSDHGFDQMDPVMFSIVKHQVELSLLDQEAEIFRRSPRTTLTEQHFVIKRYFRTIVERVHRVFDTARQDALHWLNTALNPLTLEVRDHRGLISNKIRDLKNAGDSRKTLKQRIRSMRREAQRLQVQRESLGNVQRALSLSPVGRPQMVRSDAAGTPGDAHRTAG